MKKLEIGPGVHAHPGYETFDRDPAARSTWRGELTDPWPMGDGVYDEVLGVHVLEHIAPDRVETVLRSARRVLRTGGILRIHVPDGPAIARAFAGQPSRRHELQAAIYGEASVDPRYGHRVLYDAELLRAVFERAGFQDVRDVTGESEDRHDGPWAWIGARISLKMVGRNP